MKKTLTTLLSFIFILQVDSQGLVAEGNNTLIGRNGTLNLSPLNVGLGTNSPSALLHTFGTLRFEGLPNILNNRLLVTDANGNVTWRDISTLGDANAWQINGNANINDAVNFLGTTNNQAINFRVNNQRRFSISREFTSGGRTCAQVEVGMSTDATNLANLFVWSRDVVGFSMPFFISSNVAGMTFSSAAGSNNTLGRLIRLNQGSTNANGGNDFYDVGITNTRALYFSPYQTPGSLIGMPNKMFTISTANRVGINMAWNNDPTADFHTVGSVRHENLPSGTGVMLVIDAQGNIYRSGRGRTIEELDDSIEELNNRVTAQDELISQLQNQINECCNREIYSKASKNKNEFSAQTPNKVFLFQNTPNPFTKSTVLKYSIPSDIKVATLNIYDLSGKELKSFRIIPTEGQVMLESGSLPAGMYIAIIMADNGQTSESVKMILTK